MAPIDRFIRSYIKSTFSQKLRTLKMKISCFTVFVPISNAFLHPLLNLKPDVNPERIAGRMGFPTSSFWTHKTKLQEKMARDPLNKLNKLWNMASNAVCSYPCQRISHFVKLEDVLRKKGHDYELRFVLTWIIFMRTWFYLSK